MPSCKTIKKKQEAFYLSISLVPILLGCISFAVGHAKSQPRKPQSLHDEHSHQKHQSLKTKHSFLIHTAKLALPVTIKFEMLTEAPVAGEPIEYRAIISRESSQRNFNYKLVLPDGVQLVNGLTAGTFDLTDEDVELFFTVTQSDLNDKKLSLMVVDPMTGNSNLFTFSTLDFHKNIKAQEELLARRDQYHQDIEAYRPKK